MQYREKLFMCINSVICCVVSCKDSVSTLDNKAHGTAGLKVSVQYWILILAGAVVTLVASCDDVEDDWWLYNDCISWFLLWNMAHPPFQYIWKFLSYRTFKQWNFSHQLYLKNLWYILHCKASWFTFNIKQFINGVLFEPCKTIHNL